MMSQKLLKAINSKAERMWEADLSDSNMLPYICARDT